MLRQITACLAVPALVSALSTSRFDQLGHASNNLLGKRDIQAGGACGPAAGNAVCAAGLCCSETSICSAERGSCIAPGCQLSFSAACDGNKSPKGKDTSTTPRPLLGNVPYGVGLTHCTVPGTVALTFDDGPYVYTSELLDLLAKNGVKATFFIVGTNGGKGHINDPASGYPAIVKRMLNDGHQIGSHTWSHQDMAQITAAQRRDQIVKNEIAIADVLGFIPTYFRPPYTSVNAEVMKDLKAFGYHVTDYDIDTRDWQGDYSYARNTFSTALSQRAVASSQWCAIAHDIQKGTVQGGFAQYMIDETRKRGYRLTTLGECLADDPKNWYRDPVTGLAFDVKTMPQSSASSANASSTKATPTEVSNPNFGAGTGATPSAGSGAAKSSSGVAKSSSASLTICGLLSLMFGLVALVAVV